MGLKTAVWPEKTREMLYNWYDNTDQERVIVKVKGHDNYDSNSEVTLLLKSLKVLFTELGAGISGNIR